MLSQAGAHKSSGCSPTVSEEGRSTETNGHGLFHVGVIDHEGAEESGEPNPYVEVTQIR